MIASTVETTPDLDVSVDLQPQPTWTDEQFASYCKKQMTLSSDIEANIGLLARRSTVAFFRAGKALSMVREQLKPQGEWVNWQERHGLKRTTVFEAIQLFENAKTEEAVAKIGLTEAKKRFGISGNGRSAGQRQNLKTNVAGRKIRADVLSVSSDAAPVAVLRIAIAQIDTAIYAVLASSDLSQELANEVGHLREKVAQSTMLILRKSPSNIVPHLRMLPSPSDSPHNIDRQTS